MQWCDFYDAFWDWSDSTRRTRISSLEDIGSGDEVVDAVLEIEDPKVQAQLIRKAIKLGAKFTLDDFQNLEDEIPIELYEELGNYAGLMLIIRPMTRRIHPGLISMIISQNGTRRFRLLLLRA